jgi:hypothetical protein
MIAAVSSETASGTLFDSACATLDGALGGGARGAIVAEVSAAPTIDQALARLRDRLRSDGWIRELDRRTRAEGFHVLHDWDGKADHVNPDIIPVDVLNYAAVAFAGASAPIAAEPATALLLDYYYFHLLTLLSVRVWDGGDADLRLDRLQVLLDALHGPEGSGQRFVADAETLLLVATSHYERNEDGYARLLDRTRTLNRVHRVRVAIGHATSMGCHLRFGFEATYGRDTLVMRRDNVADYPWLGFALATLMREFDSGGHDGEIVEALLNGLSADARAFVGDAAREWSDKDAAEFRDLFAAHREVLVTAFEAHRPVDGRYSPLAFFFNFAHNTIKGMVVDALLQQRRWSPSFNDLLTSRANGVPDGDKIALATTLMAYARANPDRIRGELTPVIVYDPRAGHAAFTVTMRKLRQ